MDIDTGLNDINDSLGKIKDVCDKLSAMILIDDKAECIMGMKTKLIEIDKYLRIMKNSMTTRCEEIDRSLQSLRLK